jgi:hypothetical protein
VPTVNVIVIVVELVRARVAELMSRPEMNVIFGTEEVLNSNPAGAFKMRVWPLPELKSWPLPSAMTIEPRVVQAGEAALAALSAEIFEPPLAGVMLIVASAEVVLRRSRISH